MEGSSDIYQTGNYPVISYGESESGSINVYRVQQDEHIVGWIMLCLLLAIALIIFIILWAFCVNDRYTTPSTTCFGPFGVETGLDANPINQCGTGRMDPCIFARNSIMDSETECNNLRSICNAFTFNPTNSTMKIVDRNSTFASSSANLFVRQFG